MLEFKLAFKAYEAKPSIGAIRLFKEKTGKDLFHFCLELQRCYIESRDSVELARVANFADTAWFFYALTKEGGSGASIEELQDAMFRVGVVGDDEGGDYAEPYTLIALQLALEVLTPKKTEKKK